MVTVAYYRYSVREEREVDTIEEAVLFLAYGEDSGNLSSLHGEIRDGDRVISGDDLGRLVDAAWRALV